MPRQRTNKTDKQKIKDLLKEISSLKADLEYNEKHYEIDTTRLVEAEQKNEDLETELSDKIEENRKLNKYLMEAKFKEGQLEVLKRLSRLYPEEIPTKEELLDNMRINRY